MLQMEMIASFLLPGDDGRGLVVQPITFEATDPNSKFGNTEGNSRERRPRTKSKHK